MLEIRDVMTRDVLTVTPETTLREAADLFSRHHISGAPVLAGRSVVGVVSATDLLEFVASNDGLRSPSDDRPSVENTERMRAEYDDEAASLVFTDWMPEIEMDDAEPFVMDNTLPTDLFGEHTVSEVMTCEICSLPPQALVTEAARYMWKAGVHRLLILDRGRLAGILSMSDVSRAVARREVKASNGDRPAGPS
jgi:CBS domain-containing protein